MSVDWDLKIVAKTMILNSFISFNILKHHWPPKTNIYIYMNEFANIKFFCTCPPLGRHISEGTWQHSLNPWPLLCPGVLNWFYPGCLVYQWHLLTQHVLQQMHMKIHKTHKIEFPASRFNAQHRRSTIYKYIYINYNHWPTKAYLTQISPVAYYPHKTRMGRPLKKSSSTALRRAAVPFRFSPITAETCQHEAGWRR